MDTGQYRIVTRALDHATTWLEMACIELGVQVQLHPADTGSALVLRELRNALKAHNIAMQAADEARGIPAPWKAHG